MPTGSPTGQNIVDGALTVLGILDQGGTSSVSDSSDALQKLNEMWNAYGIDEGLIYAVLAQQFALAAGVAGYTIGPATGAAFNAPRPGRIYRAVVSQASGGAIATDSLGSGGANYTALDTVTVIGANGSLATVRIDTVGASGDVVTFTVTVAGTGYTPQYGAHTTNLVVTDSTASGFTLNILTVTAGGQNRNELRIVNSDQYYSNNDLNAAAAVPNDLYPDYDNDPSGFAKIYLWPIPKVLVATMLELQVGVPFTDWSLTGTYQIPQGYQDALVMALAFRLLPSYGVAVNEQVAALVTAQGQKAEERIRAMNLRNRQLQPGMEKAPGTPPPQQAA